MNPFVKEIVGEVENLRAIVREWRGSEHGDIAEDINEIIRIAEVYALKLMMGASDDAL